MFLDRWGDELFKEAYAYIPQATVVRKLNRDGLIFAYNNLQLIELLNQVHDSIVFQISLGYTVLEHAKCLWALKQSLEQPIEFKGQEFVIPIDLSAGLVWGDLKKIKLKGVMGPEGIALQLRDVFRELNVAT